VLQRRQIAASTLPKLTHEIRSFWSQLFNYFHQKG
jgi:hypothetical protein